MKRALAKRSVPPHNRAAGRLAGFQSETRRTTVRGILYPGSSPPSITSGARRLQHSGILLLELPQFSRGEKSLWIDHGQHFAIEHRETAIPSTLVAGERLRQCKEQAHFRHLLDVVYEHRNGRTAQDQHRTRARGWKMKMLAAADHVIGPGFPLDNVPHLAEHDLLQVHDGAAQAVRAADFLDRRRGNHKATASDREHGDLFARAGLARRDDGTGRLRHRCPMGCICRQITSRCFSIMAYMSSMPTT